MRLRINTCLQGVLLLSVVALMFLPIPMTTLWWREFFNAGHTFVFMAFSYLLARRLLAKKIFDSPFFLYSGVLIIIMLVGVSIELLQGFIDREMSWGDLQNDFLGALAGLMFFHASGSGGIGGRLQVCRSVLLLPGVLLLLAGSFSLVQLSWHYLLRENAFPVIMDFGAGWSESFVRYNKATLISDVKNPRGMYVFMFLPGRYPGVNIIEPEPDWSQYRRLRLRIFSPYKEKTVFALRIHDRDHNQSFSDRFNTRLTINEGMNEIVLNIAKIQKGGSRRQLDIKNIAGLTLFVMKLERRHTFEISELYLE